MGVHGLWSLIQSTGRPVTLESLEGKILAVDVSIWLHHAMKGMRDKNGNPLPNAHLQFLFSRICKLLFYKIRPVFVFDGGVPVLKKQTLAARRDRKETAVKESEKASKKLLNILLKKQAVNQVLGKDSSSGSTVNIKSSKTPDLFELPPQPEDNTLKTKSDGEFMWESHLIHQQIIQGDYQNLDEIDIDSSDFRSLPPEVQHEILTEMKETRSHYYTPVSQEAPEETTDFSQYQVGRLLKKSKLTTRIDSVRKEMNQRNLGDLAKKLGNISSDCIESRRIMSEDASHYVLIKGISQQRQLEEALKFEETLKAFVPSDTDTDSSVGDMLLVSSDSELNSMRNVADKRYGDKTSVCSNREKNVADLDVDVHDITSDLLGSHSEKTPKSTSVQDFKKTFSDLKEETENMTVIKENEEPIPSRTNRINSDSEPLKTYKRDELFMKEGIPNVNANKSSDERNENKVLDKRKIIENEENVNNKKIKFEETESIESMQEKLEEESILEKSFPVTEADNNDLVINDMGVEDCETKVDTSEIQQGKDIEKESSVVLIDSDSSSSIREKTVNEMFTNGVSVIEDSGSEEDFIEVPSIKSDELLGHEVDHDTDFMNSTQESVETDQSIHSSQKSIDNETDIYVDHELPRKERSLASDFQRITKDDLESMQSELEFESQRIQRDQKRQDRMAVSITEQMSMEAQELLHLFGLPYVVSPMEAEAQCAFLDLNNLTHGSITDDSDIWLFGGQRVYRNFFNQSKHVEFFHNTAISSQFGLDREKMICIALLCGSDYTPGIQTVGPVTAMEIMSEFSGTGINGLAMFRAWWEDVQNDFMKKQPMAKLKSKMRDLNLDTGNASYTALLLSDLIISDQVLVVSSQFFLTRLLKLEERNIITDFPSMTVFNAYMEPEVDESKEKFSWSPPDLYSLREFAKEKFGWEQSKADDVLLPVMKQLRNKDTQRHITGFFQPDLVKLKEEVKSKRLKNVLNKMNKIEEGSIVDTKKQVVEKPLNNESQSQGPKEKQTAGKASTHGKPRNRRVNRKKEKVDAFKVKPLTKDTLNLSESSSAEDEDDIFDEEFSRQLATIPESSFSPVKQNKGKQPLKGRRVTKKAKKDDSQNRGIR